MNLDAVWTMVGDFGRFQKWSLLHWSVVGVLTGMQNLNYVIISFTPAFRCFVPGCDNDSSPFDHFDQCGSEPMVNATSCGDVISSTNGSTAPCDRWIYDASEHGASIVTKWDLVCDRANLAPLTQSLLMFGVTIGGVIFGYFTDRFGRIRVIFTSIFFASACGVLCPFVPPYSAFLALRFLIGASGMASYIICWSYLLEITGPQHRLLICLVLNSCFAIGEALVGVIGYFVHDWSTVVWVVSAPGFLWIAILCWFCESPRWLVATKKFDKAQKAFERIARINGKKVDFSSVKLDQLETEVNGDVERHYTIVDLFRARPLRWLTISLIFVWFATTLSYYGISMALPPINGNVAVSLIVVSLIEIPSYFFLFFTLDKFGRRTTLVAMLIAAGIAGVCTSPLALNADLRWLFFALALLSKFCCSCASGNLFLFSNELFPTVLRNNGVGACSMLGHVAAILSPYVVRLNVFHPAIPLTVFGCFSLMSGLAAICLPETMGKPLPDTVENLESGTDARTICEGFRKMLFRRRTKDAACSAEVVGTWKSLGP